MAQSNEKLQQALRRILRPVIRLMIRRDITLQSFVDLLKEIYVSVAEETLKNETDKVTDSHISLITGVHRKDVRAYRHKAPDTGAAPAYLSTGAELLATWMGNPRYSNEEGQPLALPYLNTENHDFSFVALAESVSKDIRPRVLLDEFLRLDIIEHDKVKNLVTLKTEAFLPREGFEEKLYYFGLNGGDHMTAAVENILAQRPPFLDRSVYYDGLTKDSVRELKKASTDGAMRLLRSINRKAFELSERDKDRPDARHRINLGTYFFTDSREDPENRGL